MMMRHNIRIFVINLARADARKKAMQNQLNGIDAEFFTASDGKNLNAEEHKLYQKLIKMPNNATRYHHQQQKMALLYPPLFDGEIGCYLSHYRLLQHIVTQKIAYAVILEDDLIMQDDWYHVANMLTNSYHTWDAMRLCGLRKRKFDRLEMLAPDADYCLAKLHNTACGAQAYMVTHQGAKKLLNLLRFMVLPVDIALDGYWQEDIAFYAVQPYVIAPNAEVASTIDDVPQARVSGKKYQNIKQRWQKFWLKHQKSYLKKRSIMLHRPQIKVAKNRNKKARLTIK